MKQHNKYQTVPKRITGTAVVLFCPLLHTHTTETSHQPNWRFVMYLVQPQCWGRSKPYQTHPPPQSYLIQGFQDSIKAHLHTVCCPWLHSSKTQTKTPSHSHTVMGIKKLSKVFHLFSLFLFFFTAIRHASRYGGSSQYCPCVCMPSQQWFVNFLLFLCFFFCCRWPL